MVATERLMDGNVSNRILADQTIRMNIRKVIALGECLQCCLPVNLRLELAESEVLVRTELPTVQLFAKRPQMVIEVKWGTGG